MASLMRLRLFTVPSPARFSLRALHTSPFRHGHASGPFSPLSHNFRLSFPNRPLPFLLIPTRAISLGSIFSSKPSPAPTPHAVAHVAKMEADANAHPYDVEKQLALFQALSETKIQPGYELIINRWERMTEFVRSSLDTPECCFLLTLDAAKLVGPCFPAPSFRQGVRVLCPGSSQSKQGTIDQSRSAQAGITRCRPSPHHSVTIISRTPRRTIRRHIYSSTRSTRSSISYIVTDRFP
jgi:hypothetical protein